MENYINEANMLSELPKKCWILKDGKYSLMLEKENRLPVIPKKYEDVLKKLNISYSIFEIEKKNRMNGFIKYWNKEFYEEEEIELPSYEFYSKMFHFKGIHKGMAPTIETIEAAKKLVRQVEVEMARARKEEKIAIIQKFLGEKNAVYVRNNEFKGNLDEGRFEHYYIFFSRRKNGNQTNHIIIFDLDKIYKEDVILELPERYADHVLGKNNCHANLWRETLGIDKIEVDVI